MAYPITKTDSTTLATIPDGQVNTSATSLTLIGKNYAGYGNFLNENFVQLLENFAYGTAPSNPLTGQLWFDNANNILKLSVNGSANQWKPLSVLTSASTYPVTPAPIDGDLFWHNVRQQLYAWSSTANNWMLIGPAYSTSGGTSGAIVETIIDSNGNSQIAVKFYIQNSVIGIISANTNSYTPSPTISGFTTVNPGFNLISSTVLAGSQFTGNVSNALALNGIPSSSFLRSDTATSTNYQLGVGNLQVGSDLIISPSYSTEVRFASYSASKKDITMYVNTGTTKAVGVNGTTGAVTFSNTVTVNSTLTANAALSVVGTTALQGVTTLSNSLLPSSNGTINIGASGTKFANVYATSMTGNVTAPGYMQTAVYATTTARDAAITSPQAGMMVLVTAGPNFWGYTGAAWVALN